MRARKSFVKDQLLAALPDYPNGVSTATIAARLRRDPDNVSTRLLELQDTGRVIGVVVQGPPKRKMWFAVEHAKQAKAYIKAAPPPHHWKASQLPRVAAYKSAPVAAPDPFFARPGYRPDLLSTGSAIERAYASR